MKKQPKSPKRRSSVKNFKKNTINKKVNKLPNRIKISKQAQRKIAFGLLGVTILIIGANLVVYGIFYKKTYPKTFLNDKPIGSTAFNQLQNKSQDIINTPENIKLTAGNKSVQVSPDKLGVFVDYQKISDQIISNRHAIPLLNLALNHKNNAVFTINKTIAETFLNKIKAELEVAGVSAKIDRQNNKFIEVTAIKPITIDLPTALQNIETSLQSGQSEITLPINEGDAPIAPVDIQAELSKLNKSTSITIKLVFNDKSKILTPAEIANLFEPKNETFVLSQKNVSNLLDSTAKGFAITLGNKTQASSQIIASINNASDATITLQPAPEKRIGYTYCVSAKGVDESYLGAFRAKLASVYADSRGWGVGGQITFSPVASGCNFTAWLTAADLVPSFSSTICDNIWSCRVGNNVIINFDRWTGASPAWNSAGGALDEYRSMVINHETGHWLGFRHRYCGGPGQTAPVMQQQSISLQGCSFNAWPTSSEIQSLKQTKGL